jgi:anhydro-N-acetylmuramic acid kinase
MAARLDDAALSELFIGLMSGTSLDGLDAVLADFSVQPPRTLAHSHRSFPADLRHELLELSSPGANEIERSGMAAVTLSDIYADAVAGVLADAGVTAAQVAAIGAHGQTVRHRPDAGYTVQLNAPARLAEATGIDVIADFRSRDIAAGGQGAPLVPAFHATVFASPQPRAVVNIGGISNVTFLRGDSQAPIGFDCGPGNVLLDLHAARHLAQPFDRGGAYAQTGRLDPELLARLLDEPYLAAAPPKSTGRELFSATWLDVRLEGSSTRPPDVQRTLTEFTARAIGDSISRWCNAAIDIVVCGGGARNATLMAALEAVVAPRPVCLSDAMGIPHDQVEALAFAWLARCCLRREPGAVPEVTGARGARVLGAIYPR